MDNMAVAVLLATALSALIGIIETRFQSKADLASCLNSAVLLYLLILMVGNATTTLAASSTLTAAGIRFAGPEGFWWAVVGVFGFEAILQNLNVTFFNKGMLSINEWITKAREHAVATTIETYADSGRKREQALANQLQSVPESELNAHILEVFDAEILQRLEDAAKAGGANPRIYKALALARQKPERARAIIAAKRRK
jgi:hypothetical protein